MWKNILFFQWIVGGLLGVDGPHALSPVEMELDIEVRDRFNMPKMVERNALAVARQQDHVVIRQIRQK